VEEDNEKAVFLLESVVEIGCGLEEEAWGWGVTDLQGWFLLRKGILIEAQAARSHAVLQTAFLAVQEGLFEVASLTAKIAEEGISVFVFDACCPGDLVEQILLCEDHLVADWAFLELAIWVLW
jgi:hypothetical protein